MRTLAQPDLIVAGAEHGAWRARNGTLGGEARAGLASLIEYLVCQMFSGYSNSWYLCGFATCCEERGRM